MDRADDGRGLRPAQDVAQGQARGHRVRVGVVVEHDQDAIRVAEVPLVLLHARLGQRPAELGEQRAAEQLRHRQVGDVGELGVELVGAPRGRRGGDAEHVHERPAGVPHGLEDLLRAAPSVVLDDDAGARPEISLDEGVGAAGVAGDDLDAGVVQAPRQRPVLDDELDLEAGQQDFVEHPDDQLVLTDGQTPHRCAKPRLYACRGGRRGAASFPRSACRCTVPASDASPPRAGAYRASCRRQACWRWRLQGRASRQRTSAGASSSSRSVRPSSTGAACRSATSGAGSSRCARTACRRRCATSRRALAATRRRSCTSACSST